MIRNNKKLSDPQSNSSLLPIMTYKLVVFVSFHKPPEEVESKMNTLVLKTMK